MHTHARAHAYGHEARAPRLPGCARASLLARPAQRGRPKVPLPPREERTFKSKYVIKDVNVKKADSLRVVDFDGTVRPSTQREAAARSWRKQSWNIRPDAKDDLLDFNPITTANPNGLDATTSRAVQE